MSVDITCGEYDGNITHNVQRMMNEAFLNKGYWVDQLTGKTGAEVLPLLTAALHRMAENPRYFEMYDSPNGWGTWRDCLPFLAKLREGCYLNPDAIIETSI